MQVISTVVSDSFDTLNVAAQKVVHRLSRSEEVTDLEVMGRPYADLLNSEKMLCASFVPGLLSR